MAKVKLTAGRVASLECPAGRDQVFLWDGEAPGLGLRAAANGAKTYVFQGKLEGKSMRVTIGTPRGGRLTPARWRTPQTARRARCPARATRRAASRPC